MQGRDQSYAATKLLFFLLKKKTNNSIFEVATVIAESIILTTFSVKYFFSDVDSKIKSEATPY